MTKIKHFSTGKASLCIVELPEGAKNIRLAGGFKEYVPKLCWEKSNNLKEYLNISMGNWSVLCLLKDITEEQAAAIVPEYEYQGRKSFQVGQPLNKLCDTALEALSDFLQSIPIYTINPLGLKPELSSWGDGWDSRAHFEYERAQDEEFLKRWTEAEQHVFRNSILLVNNETK